MHYPMMQEFLKVLNLSIKAKLGSVLMTPEREQKLLEEISNLAQMNYETNMDLNWLLDNCPEAEAVYRNYRAAGRKDATS